MKRHHLLKDKLIYQQTREQQCQLCQDEVSMPIKSQEILKNKFFKPQIESYHFRNLNDILFGTYFQLQDSIDPYSKNCMAYEEMDKNCTEGMMHHFYDWNKIIKTIKPAILDRCQNDVYGYIDFNQVNFDITLSHLLRKKEFEKRKKNIVPYKSSVSTQQTTDDKKLLIGLQSKHKIQKHQKQNHNRKNMVSPSTHSKKSNAKGPLQIRLQNRAKRMQNEVNSSVIQLRRLTKKLDMMVQPALKKPRKSSKSSKKLLSPKTKFTLTKGKFLNIKAFKQSVQKRISVISKNYDDQIALDSQFQDKCGDLLNLNDIKQNYGLKVFKNPHKKHNKLASSDKLSIPMTPKPNLCYNNQYEQRMTMRNTPRNDKFLSPQSPSVYRGGSSSRNSHRDSSKRSSGISNSSKTKTTKLKSPKAKLKK